MRKIGKVLLILLVIGIVALFSFEWWVEARFEGLINKNPESKYIVTFEDLDVKAFFDGVTLEEMRIAPRDSADSRGTMIYGTMGYAEINGIVWSDLILGRRANVNEISFIQPNFNIYLRNDTTKAEKAGNSFQVLFQDVLARAELTEFSLIEGSVNVVRVDSDTIPVGKCDNLTIEAQDLETDSVQLGYLIPFKLRRLYTSFSGIEVALDTFTTLKVAQMSYDTDPGVFEMKKVSLGLIDNWVDVSKAMGKQVDLIEVDLGTLEIHNLDTKSSLYGDLDIEASHIIIDSLSMRDHRNKNVPRPPDNEKPMFKGMVNSIPFPMEVDSIIIRNSTIAYTELGEGKDAAGTLTFGNVNGTIRNITTFPEIQQQFGTLEADLSAMLNNQAPMNVSIIVPYAEEENFFLNANITSLDATSLNPTVIPLASVRVDGGDVSNLNLRMQASRYSSSNNLVFQFENLGISVLGGDGEVKPKKRGLISGLANTMIRHQNLPGEKNYKEASFVSNRNIYRGPFNFIWQSIKEGMVLIVPSNTAAALLPKGDKPKK